MICKACGRNTVNEGANFCEYCGTSFRENMSLDQVNYSAGVSELQQSVKEVVNEEHEKPISFGNWMGTMMLPFIPLIGIFIYIVMMFVWAFGSDTPKSKKNWARASLIMMVVGIILFVLMFSSAMMQIMNSGLNIEEYMGQYY